MTAFKGLVNKTTTGAFLATIIIGTASYLAIVGAIDGPSYLGLAILAAGSFFKGPSERAS